MKRLWIDHHPRSQGQLVRNAKAGGRGAAVRQRDSGYEELPRGRGSGGLDVSFLATPFWRVGRN